VKDLALVVAKQDAGAGFEGGELVHEVEEEETIEGQAAQLGHSCDLSHEILVGELILGEPFDAVEEALGDWQQVKEFDEPGQWFLVVSDDGGPSYLGRVGEVDLVGEGSVALDRADSGHDSG
jgi:hypothetical protein